VLPTLSAQPFDRPANKRYKSDACNFCHERNPYDHKAKRGNEKGDSDAEIKVGWQESSKKEAESHR
jgi:hypothetical protein